MDQSSIASERKKTMKHIAVALFTLLTVVTLQASTTKSYDATYLATIAAVPDGVKELKVWIPLPVTRGPQTVSEVKIDSPYPFTTKRDAETGNEYAFATIQNPPSGDLVVQVHFRATRAEETMEHPTESAASAAELRHDLEANRLVTLSPRVRKLADEVTAGKSNPMDQARAIYDHLLATMKYDKTIAGWGKGDTERACDIRAGNCTDFHSLFMSMARAKGIPARFVIGFPLTAKDGKVAGYHCWAEFYVKGKGWIPVDPSEGSKSSDPAVRKYLFGNLDPDRVQFTIGRDLELTPKTSEPLNYFIYPRAEADGKEVGTPSIALQFRELKAEGKAN
jgi:transglutaminase-like putative cysteine protease